MNGLCGLLAMACVHAALAAQTAASPLHAAWLRETLDLDMAGAIRSYRKIAQDTQAPMLERQIAAARLEELRRIGVRDTDPGKLLELVPVAVRTDADAQRPSSASQDARPAQEGNRNQPPVPAEPLTRPLVAALVQYTREEMFPGQGDRGRMPRNRNANTETARVVERIRAFEIARAELAGKTDEADALRRRSFPTWKAQPWPADAAAAWSRARQNLVSWQQDRQISASERETLRQLLAALDEDAKGGAEKPLARIDRLPLYAERLKEGLPQSR